MSSKENAYRRISGFGKLLAECQTQVRFILLRMNLRKRLNYDLAIPKRRGKKDNPSSARVYLALVHCNFINVFTRQLG